MRALMKRILSLLALTAFVVACSEFAQETKPGHFVLDGVDYGEGVEIDHVVWAPVNCGYSDSKRTGTMYVFLGNEYVPWGNLIAEDSRNACPEGWRMPTSDEFLTLATNSSFMQMFNGITGRWYSGLSNYDSTNPSVFLPLENNNGDGLSYWTSSGTYRNPYSFNGEVTKITDPGKECLIRCVKGTADKSAYDVPGAIEKYSDTDFYSVRISELVWAPFPVDGVYNYEKATTICPDGYRLPLKEEFMNFKSYFYGMYYGRPGYWLSADWIYNDNHSALFLPKSSDEYWVTNRLNLMPTAYCCKLDDEGHISLSSHDCSEMHYVRCVKGDNNVFLTFSGIGFDEKFESGDEIGVYTANYSDAGGLSGKQYYNVRHYYENGNWIPEEPLYWQNNGDRINFICFFPYSRETEMISADTYRFSISSDQNTADGYRKSDFMWGKVTGVSPMSNAVQVGMSHALCKLVFKIAAADGIVVDDISLENIPVSGMLNIANGKVEACDETGSITCIGNGNNTYSAVIIPQSGKLTPKVTYKVYLPPYGLIETCSMQLYADFLREPGKVYTGNIKIERNEVFLSNFEISPWNEML